MKTSSFSLVVLTLGILLLFSANHAEAQSIERVRFAAGATAATVRGTLKGNVSRYRDYIVRGRAGQQMSLEFLGATKAEVVVFDSNEENLSFGVKEWTGELPEDGDYKVRVILNRAFARRGAQTSYVLKISIR
ncbi:MAG TPA: hypothetical protein VF692_02395 [Pyrinomonadaceae bacterium]|jgi:hypothetical protein